MADVMSSPPRMSTIEMEKMMISRDFDFSEFVRKKTEIRRRNGLDSPTSPLSIPSSSSSDSPDSSHPRLPPQPTSYICISLGISSASPKQWFAVGPSNPESEPPRLQPACQMPRKYPNCSMLSIGTKIYAIGGDDEKECDKSSARAVVYDTAKPEDGWKELSPMLSPKLAPALVTLDGRIYAIGCCRGYKSDVVPWGEVYDPLEDKWTSIIMQAPGYDHPTDGTVRAACAVVEQKRQILIRTHKGKAYFYNIGSSPNIPLHPKHIAPSCIYSAGSAFLVVDNILYGFTDECTLYAYNLKHGRKNMWKRFSTEIRGLEEYFSHHASRRLFFSHTGNMNFCLVWSTLRGHKVPSQFYRLNFHIHGCQKTSQFSAIVDNFESFELKPACNLEKCVQVMHNV